MSHSKYVEKQKSALKSSKMMVISELGRQRPQKIKDTRLVRVLGTSTHGKGVTKMGTL